MASQETNKDNVHSTDTLNGNEEDRTENDKERKNEGQSISLDILNDALEEGTDGKQCSRKSCFICVAVIMISVIVIIASIGVVIILISKESNDKEKMIVPDTSINNGEVVKMENETVDTANGTVESKVDNWPDINNGEVIKMENETVHTENGTVESKVENGTTDADGTTVMTVKEVDDKAGTTFTAKSTQRIIEDEICIISYQGKPNVSIDYNNQTTMTNNLKPDNIAPCEKGWSFFLEGNKCVKAFDEKVTWGSASLKCRDVGGRLLTVRNYETRGFVIYLLKENLGFYWIGLTDLKHSSSSIGEDESLLIDSNNNGQPDDYGEREECIQITSTVYWNDLDCGLYDQRYICEKQGPGCKYMNGGCEEACSDETDLEWEVSCKNYLICSMGYGKFKSTCCDIDECSFDNGGCDQGCHNIPGSFECHCYLGYEKHGRRCFPSNSSSWWDVSDTELDIYYYSLKNFELYQKISDLHRQGWVV